MSFKLIKYTVECSERGDSSETIAIANSEEALKSHLENDLGKSLERDKTNPFADYFVISPSKVIIVSDEKEQNIQETEEAHY